MTEPTGPSDPSDPTEPLDATRPLPAAQQPAAAQASAQPKGPNLWRQARSTTGGTIALVVASVLTLLLVVGVLGLGAAAVVRTVAGHGDDRGDRMGQMREGRNGDLPPGQQRRLEDGKANGNGNGNGNGKAKDKDSSKGDRGNGQNGAGGLGSLGGLGMGSMMSGVGALGEVQHGEFTTQDSTGTAVVMTVQRGTVSAVTDTSVAVKSADGFSATYAVDDATRGRADEVVKGDEVLVVARKTGSKAVVIRALRSS